MKKIIYALLLILLSIAGMAQNTFYAKTNFYNDVTHKDNIPSIPGKVPVTLHEDSVKIRGAAGTPAAGKVLQSADSEGTLIWADGGGGGGCTDTVFTGKYMPDTLNGENINAIGLDSAIYTVLGNTVTVTGLITRFNTTGAPQSISLSIPVASDFENQYDLTGTVSSSLVATGYYIVADTVNDRALLQLGNDALSGGFMTYTFTYWLPDNITACIPCNISGGGGGSQSIQQTIDVSPVFDKDNILDANGNLFGVVNASEMGFQSNVGIDLTSPYVSLNADVNDIKSGSAIVTTNSLNNAVYVDADSTIQLSVSPGGNVIILNLREFANDAAAGAATPPVPLPGGVYINSVTGAMTIRRL